MKHFSGMGITLWMLDILFPSNNLYRVGYLIVCYNGTNRLTLYMNTSSINHNLNFNKSVFSNMCRRTKWAYKSTIHTWLNPTSTSVPFERSPPNVTPVEVQYTVSIMMKHTFWTWNVIDHHSILHSWSLTKVINIRSSTC